MIQQGVGYPGQNIRFARIGPSGRGDYVALSDDGSFKVWINECSKVTGTSGRYGAGACNPTAPLSPESGPESPYSAPPGTGCVTAPCIACTEADCTGPCTGEGCSTCSGAGCSGCQGSDCYATYGYNVSVCNTQCFACQGTDCSIANGAPTKCNGPHCTTCVGGACTGCQGSSCTACTGQDCSNSKFSCTGSDCRVCVGSDCNQCNGSDCQTCTGTNCNGCNGHDCTVCSGSGCKTSCQGSDCPGATPTTTTTGPASPFASVTSYEIGDGKYAPSPGTEPPITGCAITSQQSTTITEAFPQTTDYNTIAAGLYCTCASDVVAGTRVSTNDLGTVYVYCATGQTSLATTSALATATPSSDPGSPNNPDVSIAIRDTIRFAY